MFETRVGAEEVYEVSVQLYSKDACAAAAAGASETLLTEQGSFYEDEGGGRREWCWTEVKRQHFSGTLTCYRQWLTKWSPEKKQVAYFHFTFSVL